MKPKSQLNKSSVEKWGTALFGGIEYKAEYEPEVSLHNKPDITDCLTPIVNVDEIAFHDIARKASGDEVQRSLVCTFFKKLGNVVIPYNDVGSYWKNADLMRTYYQRSNMSTKYCVPVETVHSFTLINFS